MDIGTALAGPVWDCFSRGRSFCPSEAKLRSGRLASLVLAGTVKDTLPAPCRHAPLKISPSHPLKMSVYEQYILEGTLES